MEPSVRAIASFVERHSDAAMVTLRSDGSAHMARIELAVVDGEVRSTGSPTSRRTRNLRRDGRCSLFVFGSHPWWLGLEGHAAIIEGEPAIEALMELLRARHASTTPPGMVMAHDDSLGGDRLYDEEEFVSHARYDGLLVYSFTFQRAYGNHECVRPPARRR